MKTLSACLPLAMSVAALIPIATVASSQTLTVTLEVTNITYEYEPPENVGFWLPGGVTHRLECTPVTLTNINLTNYSTFALRIAAPPGQKFFTYATNYYSYVDVWLTTAFPLSCSSNTDASLDFEQFVGELPTPDTGGRSGCIGDSGLLFRGAEYYTGWVEFSAMVYSFTPAFNPTNVPKTFQIISPMLQFSHTVLPEVRTGPFMGLTSTNNVPSPRIQKAVEVSWNCPGFDLLQPEWTDDMGTNAVWHPLGPLIQATPGTNKVYDLASPPHRFYRLRRP